VTSERTGRRIERLLDEAEQAMDQGDWRKVGALAAQILRLDPGNADAQSFLGASQRVPEVAGLLQAASLVEQRTDAVGTLPTSFAAGRYEVKRFLGEGGKKRVYLAHDATLDRDVAFALIKTEGLDQTARDRVAREAKAMGRLGAHPHIVSVYDLGEEDGQPYMVTELMEGGDVEGLIEKAPEHCPPLERTLEIGIQVCRGLEFAHGQKIVHRDLKPGNVWLTADGVAKIGDFGLAVAIDKTRLTQAGMMVGTVNYMPPEQSTGGEVTPQSDLYSLGAMLYEMVAGRPPFVGDEAVAIIGQHLNTPPVAPTWHRSDCPPGLEALILRLLEKDPAKRPTSATEVREALRTMPTGEGGIRPPASAERATAESSADNPLYRRVFVGREGELRQLRAAFDAALSGNGALAMVVGEPGIGKTAVCEQLATYVALRGGKTLTGHCYEEGSLSLPYLPFVEAMRSYVLGREPNGLKSDLGSGAGEVARIVSEIRDRVHVEPVEEGDAEEQRWRLLQAVSGFLRNASQVQPLLIVLEDLHDADRGTLDLLVHIARNLEGARLLLVGTYRDVEVDRSHPLSSALAELRRGQNFMRVPLRGLTAEEVQRMMASVSQQDVPWPMAEVVHRQTEGNPLFVQEMLRYIVEEGLVERREGALRRVGDDTLAGRIPEGLRDVIGKRLARLSEQTNQVLSVAAVIGREFRLDVLQRVLGLPEEELYRALEEATALAVVEQRQAVGTVGFRFSHAFFRQTLYEEQFIPRRIRWHQQVGRALEAVYGPRLEEHAAELAEHFAQSTEREDLEKALRYCELAAGRAMSVYAYGEAERHMQQALKVQEVLDPDDKSKRCDLLLALGEAMLPSDDPARAARTVAAEAFELAESLPDSRRSAAAAVLALESLTRAEGGRAFGSKEFAGWVEGADHHTAAGSRERVYTDICLFQHALVTAGPVAAHPFLRQALDGAPAHADNATFFLAAGWGLNNLLALRDRDRRSAIPSQAVIRSRVGARSGDLAVFLVSLGHVCLEIGDRDGAERAWHELEELAERTGDVAVRLISQAPAIELAVLDGHLEEAVRRSDARDVLSEQVRTRLRLARSASPARALIYLGKKERALELVGLATFNPRTVMARRAVCLAAIGRHDEARALREKFGDIGSDEDETATGMLVNLLEAAVLGRDADTARALSRRLAILESCAWEMSSAVAVGRLLGGAVALLGERENARTYFEQTLESCERIRNRPELALTRLELAELLLDYYPNERAAAIEHLDFAIGEFREMKMQPSLERALRHKEVLKA
jgi:tetratricopeptide (TPR) repeat protein